MRKQLRKYPKYRREQKLCAKLSDMRIEEIHRLHGQGMTGCRLAKMFNVCESTISWNLKSKKEQYEIRRQRYVRRKGLDLLYYSKKRNRELVARKISFFKKEYTLWVSENNKKYWRSIEGRKARKRGYIKWSLAHPEDKKRLKRESYFRCKERDRR